MMTISLTLAELTPLALRYRAWVEERNQPIREAIAREQAERDQIRQKVDQAHKDYEARSTKRSAKLDSLKSNLRSLGLLGEFVHHETVCNIRKEIRLLTEEQERDRPTDYRQSSWSMHMGGYSYIEPTYQGFVEWLIAEGLQDGA